MSDILLAVDRDDFAALVLLDLSADFDTVDHDILLRRLQTSFGIHGVALDWLRSYLVGRTQYVRRGSAQSSTVYLSCCVSQGSVLGPILFIMYMYMYLCHSSNVMNCRLTSTLMTRKSTVPVRRATLTRS